MITRDILRQSANLVLAPLMWVTSSLGFFIPRARSAGEFSDLSTNLLVPFPAAFSIWFPIFVGCVGYGIIQALPRYRTLALFRQVGGWTAAGFTCVCGWAVITAFAPLSLVQWGTALIFVPALAAFIKALVNFAPHRGTMSRTLFWTSYVPVSLITGWCSLAVFLNWTPIAYDVFARGQASAVTSFMVLAAALVLIIAVFRRSRVNRVYLIPPIWGLGFLAYRHLLGAQDSPHLGWAALAAIALLILTAFIFESQAPRGHNVR